VGGGGRRKFVWVCQGFMRHPEKKTVLKERETFKANKKGGQGRRGKGVDPDFRSGFQCVMYTGRMHAKT